MYLCFQVPPSNCLCELWTSHTCTTWATTYVYDKRTVVLRRRKKCTVCKTTRLLYNLRGIVIHEDCNFFVRSPFFSLCYSAFAKWKAFLKWCAYGSFHATQDKLKDAKLIYRNSPCICSVHVVFNAKYWNPPRHSLAWQILILANFWFTTMKARM